MEELPLVGPSCCPGGLLQPMARTEAMGLARLFKAIADPTRLQILSLITSAPEHELCACELYEPLGLSQPTVSHHLKVLTMLASSTGSPRDLGLVLDQARGIGRTVVRAAPGGYFFSFNRRLSPSTTSRSTVRRAVYLSFAGTRDHGAKSEDVRAIISLTATAYSSHFSRLR